MKSSYRGVIALCIVVFLSIVCTQKVVSNFFYERYENVVWFAVLNLLLFPIAVIIYKRERDVE